MTDTVSCTSETVSYSSNTDEIVIAINIEGEMYYAGYQFISNKLYTTIYNAISSDVNRIKYKSGVFVKVYTQYFIKEIDSVEPRHDCILTYFSSHRTISLKIMYNILKTIHMLTNYIDKTDIIYDELVLSKIIDDYKYYKICQLDIINYVPPEESEESLGKLNTEKQQYSFGESIVFWM
jgi:hypothetical protein